MTGKAGSPSGGAASSSPGPGQGGGVGEAEGEDLKGATQGQRDPGGPAAIRDQASGIRDLRTQQKDQPQGRCPPGKPRRTPPAPHQECPLPALLYHTRILSPQLPSPSPSSGPPCPPPPALISTPSSQCLCTTSTLQVLATLPPSWDLCQLWEGDHLFELCPLVA